MSLLKTYILVFVTMLVIGQYVDATWRRLECYKCDQIMDACVFRCDMYQDYARWYYCSDYCDRQQLGCKTNCELDL
ncbi:hypothetical protein KUTeg_001748 [Tegillarca granosa]|uniref:Uncharacterized protein n=1 Tax=Tegillarca granosa TaxID=220873 RepID=A0ABQ9FTT1_TEGGR|nr:hypothetical protein KUTeg_001748 [Tegillarca granosa]